MAFDEGLAERVREIMAAETGMYERKMFGGIGWMVHGNLAVGIIGEDLMVRVGPDAYEAALAKPHARVMDFTGKGLKNLVYVAPEGVKTKRALATWIKRGTDFVHTLPRKG